MLHFSSRLRGLVFSNISEPKHVVVRLEHPVTLVISVLGFILHLAFPVGSHLSLTLLLVCSKPLLIISKPLYIVFNNSAPDSILLLLKACEVHTVAMLLIRLLPL